MLPLVSFKVLMWVNLTFSLRVLVRKFIFKLVDLCSGALTFSRVTRWSERKPSDWSERYYLTTQYNLFMILCWVNLISICYFSLSDDNSERTALSQLCGELSDRCGQRRAAGEGSHGSSLHRHHL